jgi:hypothetical protein
MRWKLIRRRLSISAPRVIVRSHLPWPLRWAVAALVFGFCAALALWAFEFGREFAGLEPNDRDELARVRTELDATRQERDRAQSLANTADSLIKAEQSANEQLSMEIRKLQARTLALEADLGFFERLLPVGGQPMQLRALQVDTIAPGQLRYQMLVMQGGKNAREFAGSYDVVLTGTLSGRPWSTSLPNGPKPLKLRQYIRLEGVIEHPPQAVLQVVQARVMDPQGVVQAAGSEKLP